MEKTLITKIIFSALLGGCAHYDYVLPVNNDNSPLTVFVFEEGDNKDYVCKYYSSKDGKARRKVKCFEAKAFNN
jgi:hypothetical protein